MDTKKIEKLIKRANSYDQRGDYKLADQIDQLIRLAAGEKHTDSAGVIWINIGTPQSLGIMGKGFIWERQDTKAKQNFPEGTLPNSATPTQTKAPVAVTQNQATISQPAESESGFGSLYKALTQ